MKVLMITRKKWNTLTEGERGFAESFMTEVSAKELKRISIEWLDAFDLWQAAEGDKEPLFADYLLSHINH